VVIYHSAFQMVTNSSEKSAASIFSVKVQTDVA
jgi:hypothetical protein